MYIQKELQRGYNPYLQTAGGQDAGTQMDVGVLIMEAGDEYFICEPDKESAVSLLCGHAVLSWNDEMRICSRPDMFNHEASCLLAPAGTNIRISTDSHAEFYIQQTSNSIDYKPVFYGPDDIDTQHAGADGQLLGTMKREIKTFFDHDNAPFSNMVLGEILNYPGKWSSYPPHHHPQPEVYFYRFDRPQGFGAGFANGEVYKTGNNGLSVINHGFHSQVAAPGYAMCYLWGIRHLDGDPWLKTRIDEPEHTWLLDKDANDNILQG